MIIWYPVQFFIVSGDNREIQTMLATKFQPGLRRWITILALAVVSLSALTQVAAQDDSEEEYIVGVELVADGFAAPVALATPNDGSGRLFVVDQVGTIRIVSADGTLLPEPFLDLSSQIVTLDPNYDERGLLGLAFHPDYANNGRFFVYYSAPLRADAPAGWNHTNILAEFSVSSDNPDVANPDSEQIVMQIDQPQFNHNAGHITFGPDGFLYIPIGDGGGANDNDVGHTPDLGNGQDVTEVHGSILRIDVNGSSGGYAIPTDNPFAGQEGMAQEIYAYGLRNPYHISFDKGGDHQLFAADAGQDEYEEVDIITLGGNYGWHIKEGTHCFNAVNPAEELDTCASAGAGGEALIDPIIEYSHAQGVVVVGGYVYRGSALSDLEGYYIFGDYTKSFDNGPDGSLFWAEKSEDDDSWEWGDLQVGGMENGRLGAFVIGFGQDDEGELYVMTSDLSGPGGDTGKVWKLVPTSEVPEPAVTESADAEGTEMAEPAVTESADAEGTELPAPAVTESP
jgi:glucose/arabinose dehydrogenase